MKILVVGKFYTEGFALHIAETLEHMGHVVSRFEPGHRAGRLRGRVGHRIDQVLGVIHSSTDGLPAVRSRRMERLWSTVDAEHPEAVIVCHDFLWPEEVAQLKERIRGPVAMWFPDAISNFGRGFFMTAPYDALFFKDPFIVSALADVLRSPIYYLPECFNPMKHCLSSAKPQEVGAFECDITTAGSQHSWRVSYFSHLADYDVRVWGNPAPLWMPKGVVGRMHQGRSVFNEEKALAFTSAKIVLNTLHYAEVWGVNARCFEAAGVGAFQMVDWRPGLEQLFEDGTELVSFTGARDLRQKIEYWLPRKDERQAIAECGRRRAMRDHTYELRLELLLDTLGGTGRGFPLPEIETRRGSK